MRTVNLLFSNASIGRNYLLRAVRRDNNCVPFIYANEIEKIRAAVAATARITRTNQIMDDAGGRTPAAARE